MKINVKLYWIIISFLSISGTIWMNHLLNVKELLYDFYSEKLVQEQVENLLSTQQKWTW